MAGLKFQAERAALSLAADKVLKYMNKTDDSGSGQQMGSVSEQTS